MEKEIYGFLEPFGPRTKSKDSEARDRLLELQNRYMEKEKEIDSFSFPDKIGPRAKKNDSDESSKLSELAINNHVPHKKETGRSKKASLKLKPMEDEKVASQSSGTALPQDEVVSEERKKKLGMMKLMGVTEQEYDELRARANWKRDIDEADTNHSVVNPAQPSSDDTPTNLPSGPSSNSFDDLPSNSQNTTDEMNDSQLREWILDHKKRSLNRGDDERKSSLPTK